ncbi:hypothetical protein M3649_19115 [Ureibacillus chungkukjangi]|uniref:hypothetical protein n=1 Tax=Ureibacillus chungkukjangi TaxID=1202712 RepID=UPI00203FBC2E|nr:hypothetical protein [Ureibacillus chungkukjangi]MCM3390211.1 hypothetical protein [Ureibacillus chungkukjangi]
MAMLANISQYLVLIGIVGFLIIAAFFIIQMLKNKNAQKRALGKAKASNFEAKFNYIAQKSYNYTLKIPVIRNLITRIRRRIETLSVYDEYSLRREVMKIIYTVLIVAIFIILLLLVVRPSWLVALWILLGVVFISGILIDTFVYRVEARLLKQLKEFNNRVRFFYQQTKMVDEAIFDSIQFVGPEMKNHAERIYNILISVEPEKELAKYEEVAPTRFLKVIAGLSLLVQDQGDKFSEKGSAYLRALSAVNQELNNEILYRSKLAYQLRSLSTLALAPIFFALPLKNWAIANFSIMQSFYDSRIGFLAEVSVYAISIICYLVIRKLREVTEPKNPMGMRRKHWEQWIFAKLPFVEKLVVALTPQPYSKKYFQLQQLIKDANAPYKVEWLTLHKIVIGLSIFFVLTSGFILAHVREEHGALNNILSDTIFAGTLSEEDILAEQEKTEFDKDVIQHIKESNTTISDQELRTYLSEQLGVDLNNPEVITAYDRIAMKWEIVKNSYLKWWELLSVIIISFIFSYATIWNLQFKKFLRRKEMETEVHQHLVLISSLKEFDRMSVYIILIWMERFSVVFKEPLQICLQGFDGGPEEALNQLKEDVSFEAFQQIIERLNLAVIRISVKEAFDDIDMEREFYLDQRKETQSRSLDTKGEIGGMLGFAPIVALTLIYLVIPLIYISVVKSNDTLMYLQ